MDSVSSRRGWFNYFQLIILFLTLLMLGAFMLYLWFENLDASDPKEFLLPLFGVIFILYAPYNVYGYFEQTPQVTIDNLKIQIANKTYKLTDISQAKFTGKHKHNFLMMASKESAEIIFSNGDVFYINDNLYSNSAQLKVFLESVLSRDEQENIDIKSEKKTFQSTQNISIAKSPFLYYKGSYFYSSIGIATIAVAVIATFNFIRLNAHWSIYIFIGFFLVIFQLLFIFRFHYFGVNNKALVVKNKLIFWREHTYLFTEIEAVVFEPATGKKPAHLCIITTDYESRFYFAITLQKKHWLGLKEHLEQYNITVRNELNF